MNGLPNQIEKEVTIAVLFGGIGGFSSGAKRSRIEYGGKLFKTKLLCSIDYDPIACMNHDAITGGKESVVMDLFTRQQYKAWHGTEPPPEWREAEPWDIWKAFGCQVPFYLFTSAPCKGLSALLPEEAAESEKYQALNFLTVRGVELTLQACLDFGGKVPAFIHMENVPRILSRGKKLLSRIREVLEKFGYKVDMRANHNLGEVGGLGQNRLRFQFLSRHETQIPNFVYLPVKKPLKTIGQVIGPLPVPGDTVNGGPMHRVPKLKRKTWERLIAIPKGKDWKALEGFDHSKYRLLHQPRAGAWAVEDWNETSRTVTGGAGVGRSNGAAAISDPRVNFKSGTHASIYRVVEWDEPGPTVTGAVGPNNGAISIGDPRLTKRDSRHGSTYKIVSYDETSPCVTGTRFGSGAIAISDPRLGCKPRSGTYGVMDWDQTGSTVVGSSDVHAGSSAVADPRIPGPDENCVMIIIALDGTWHRPLTTFELAMLQSFPRYLPDGRPFQLEGCSDAKAREYIGNAYPPDAAEEAVKVILLAAAKAEDGVAFEFGWDHIWVQPRQNEESQVLH